MKIIGLMLAMGLLLGVAVELVLEFFRGHR